MQLMPSQKIRKALGQWDKNSYNMSISDRRGMEATRAPVYAHIPDRYRVYCPVCPDCPRCGCTQVAFTTQLLPLYSEWLFRGEDPISQCLPALPYIRKKLFSCVACAHKGAMSYPSIGLDATLLLNFALKYRLHEYHVVSALLSAVPISVNAPSSGEGDPTGSL
jgi:hypothetical protein